MHLGCVYILINIELLICQMMYDKERNIHNLAIEILMLIFELLQICCAVFFLKRGDIQLPQKGQQKVTTPWW